MRGEDKDHERQLASAVPQRSSRFQSKRRKRIRAYIRWLKIVCRPT